MVLVGMQRTSRVAQVLNFASNIADRLPLRTRRSLYAALGVAPDADADAIKAAYRALARRIHPDVNAGHTAASAAHLAEVNNAYATLSNADARAAYDRELAQRNFELRRRYAAFAGVSILTFAVTAGAVSLTLLRHLGTAPDAARATLAGGDPGQGAVRGAAAAGEDAGPGASDAPRSPIWKTYRDQRYDVAL